MIKSSTWISNLPLELSMLNPEDYVQPEWVKKDKEIVVGEMPDDLKRVFTLFRGYQKLAAQTSVELQFAYMDQKPVALGKTNEYNSKAEVLQRILWYSINEYFDLWTHPQIGVRQEYQIVYSDEIPPPPMMGFQFGGREY